jgi:cyclopropane fatty-acyl-phospholipid synthase-like methyltransferase
VADNALSLEDYYASITRNLLEHGETVGWHFGLWDESTRTLADSLLKSNEILVSGCDFRPGQRVLDAGCGLGSLAVHLARTYNVDVTGITICEAHVGISQDLARRSGVESLTRFHRMDLMDLTFEDRSFDYVFNQETFCYASEKLAYLRSVQRVLKPGGAWQAVDGFLSGKPMTTAQDFLHLQMQRGWRMPPLTSTREVAQHLSQLGFRNARTRDLSIMAAPTCRAYVSKYLPRVPAVAGDRVTQENMDAVLGASIGLLEGVMTYEFVRGSKI